SRVHGAAGHDTVRTVARSHSRGSRSRPIGQDDLHAVEQNTVWSSLLGRFDGHTAWQPLRAFSCNDLVKHGAVFACTRTDWQNLYQSVLVFPLMFAAAEAGRFEFVGFLAFDSRRKNAFPGVPDAFEKREHIDEYHL